MKIVVSLGGSLITHEFSAKKISKYAQTLKTIKKTTDKLVVVIGGGKIARKYIKILKDLGMDDEAQDRIAITATHLNAKLMAMALNSTEAHIANETIPASEQGIIDMVGKFPILVCGGTIPGQSTDNVSAKIARDIKADLLINASDIDGVYDSDPKKDRSAKKYKTLNYDEFIKIIAKNEQSPGKYALFDRKAAQIIKEQKIKTVMIDAGDNPLELKRAIKGTHSGTTIQQHGNRSRWHKTQDTVAGR